MIHEFDDLRPYNDAEIPAAMQRIASDPLLDVVAANFFKGITIDDVKALLLSVKTVDEFQHKIMHRIINGIAQQTTSGVEVSGFDHLDKNKSYLFVANHRDIVLDSAFLQAGLDANGFRTTEITFGSNLMKPQFAVDFGKSNKMFKVIRDGSVRDFIKNSLHLSKYIRHTITRKNESIWIAQRSGRTKNGNDLTDQGIIKMFAMSAENHHEVEALLDLNIVPLAISYQIEPCDYLKARELFLSQSGPYKKDEWEDLNSIVEGVKNYKGKVNIQIMPPINNKIAQLKSATKNELYKLVAGIIDEEIYKGYKLFNYNYIAYDLLNSTNKYEGNYTPEDKATFIAEMNRKIDPMGLPSDDVKRFYLSIYANPVVNHL
ncbi:acyltransferase [Tenuifilaceae bacterium CYCD]|nr:acyltransferase [Tenuifilaceae bacterium CYCD]